MSHHLDYIEDPRLDISDVWCFRGRSGTVFVIDVAPLAASGFHPEGVYEFKIDTDGNSRENLAFRVTMPEDGSGGQKLRVEKLTGRAARDRDATGKLITPEDARLEQIIECDEGIMVFAGERGEPFYNDPRLVLEIKAAMAAGIAPNFATYDPRTAQNAFGESNISAIVLEVPRAVTGSGTIGFWGNTVLPTDAGGWRQLQHAANPVVGLIWTFDEDFNATHPTEQKKKFGAQVARETATVVAAMGTHPNPKKHGAYVRDTLLPDVLRYDVGTDAHYGPRDQNGKGLTESAMESVFELVLNTYVEMGLGPEDATGTLLDVFPYLSEPIDVLV